MRDVARALSSPTLKEWEALFSSAAETVAQAERRAKEAGSSAEYTAALGAQATALHALGMACHALRRQTVRHDHADEGFQNIAR